MRRTLEVHKEKQPEGCDKIIIHTDNEHYLHILDGIIHILSEMEHTTKIIGHNTCNDCMTTKMCLLKPKWGEPVRINCPFYVGEVNT